MLTAHKIPLALYVHIPWCVRKCPYCDFNSHALKGELPAARYADALIADLDYEINHGDEQRVVQSIFFGGGTPSLFPPEVIASILDAIKTRLSIAPTAEITLEANPGTVEHGLFGEYRQTGINRISLGVQSFNNAHLERIGRIHSDKQALAAIEEIHDAGIDNFNIDLMYGLPGQTVNQALNDLRQAIAVNPAHVSHYELTLEPNTLFYIKQPILPDEEVITSMQQECTNLLAAHKFHHYEVSAYSQPGRHSQHNLNYWEFGDYLGIGAGAHDKRSKLSRGLISRNWKCKHPRKYMETAGTVKCISGTREVSGEELAFEFMLNALRLCGGFEETLFTERTSLGLDAISAKLAKAIGDGLLRRDDGRLKPTKQGALFLNDLQAYFLPASSDTVGGRSHSAT